MFYVVIRKWNSHEFLVDPRELRKSGVVCTGSSSKFLNFDKLKKLFL